MGGAFRSKAGTQTRNPLGIEERHGRGPGRGGGHT